MGMGTHSVEEQQSLICGLGEIVNSLKEPRLLPSLVICPKYGLKQYECCPVVLRRQLSHPHPIHIQLTCTRVNLF